MVSNDWLQACSGTVCTCMWLRTFSYLLAKLCDCKASQQHPQQIHFLHSEKKVPKLTSYFNIMANAHAAKCLHVSWTASILILYQRVGRLPI